MSAGLAVALDSAFGVDLVAALGVGLSAGLDASSVLADFTAALTEAALGLTDVAGGFGAASGLAGVVLTVDFASGLAAAGLVLGDSGAVAIADGLAFVALANSGLGDDFDLDSSLAGVAAAGFFAADLSLEAAAGFFSGSGLGGLRISW